METNFSDSNGLKGRKSFAYKFKNKTITLTCLPKFGWNIPPCFGEVFSWSRCQEHIPMAKGKDLETADANARTE